jgi:thioredoxin 1
MIKKLDKTEDFYKIIEKGTWLVDFFAAWCGPCRMLEPVLNEFSLDNNVLQVDIDQFDEITASFDIMSVPTLIVFKEGKKTNQTVGYRSIDELKDLCK